MEQVCDYRDCTGCFLCAGVCPKKCISVSLDSMGHPYPVIDRAECIDCGLCVKSCPSLKDRADDCMMSEPSDAYAAWAKDSEEYRSSASGGAASVLARYFISQGGVAYGCSSVPSEDGKGPYIRHIRVTSGDEVSLLKGSKYVQSSISDILPLVRKDVREGRKVLFVGTPCQVAAVKGLFSEDPDNLMLVDIICHGVPSSEFFREYVSGYLKIAPGNVGRVTFRSEGKFSMLLFSAGGDVLYSHQPLTGLRTEELYYNLFMDAFTYRDSCYRCRYARPERISDITIGDFWGVGDGLPPHPDGVSVLLPVSDKGREIIASLKDRMNLYRRTVGEAVAGNEQLRHPRHKSLRIKVFRLMSRFLGLGVYYPLMADIILRNRIRGMFGLRRKK